MAHKTLVGGTAYEVTGGKCLVGGTAYSIKKGRTLVGGTGYDVSLASSVIPVIITGSPYFSYATVTINGSTYESPANVEVYAGDVIKCSVKASGGASASVSVNGTTVASTQSSTTYNWTVPECSGITINLARMSNGEREFGKITITTT